MLRTALYSFMFWAILVGMLVVAVVLGWISTETYEVALPLIVFLSVPISFIYGMKRAEKDYNKL
jgi:hypothetical protein